MTAYEVRPMQDPTENDRELTEDYWTSEPIQNEAVREWLENEQRGTRDGMITLDDVRTLDTEVPVETSDVPEDTAHNDEKRVRQLVRDMYVTPGGRALLEWLCTTPAGTWEAFRERYPHVTDEEWAKWGL